MCRTLVTIALYSYSLGHCFTGHYFDPKKQVVTATRKKSRLNALVKKAAKK
jgi:hypothetical protein